MGPWRKAERAFDRLAGRTALAAVSVGVLSLVASLGLALGRGLPQPSVHDEFSYLLAADTFLHGRVANPPHPLWPHFETIHVVQLPTYVSKYPPGQGLSLAAGRCLAGEPIVGVWLATALACSAIVWMLRAWMPPRWALAGGAIVALHPLTLVWSQRYWGGSLAMLGGALLLGGYRRVVREWRSADGAWTGLGMAVLAATRPYEGALLSAAAGAAMAAAAFAARGAGARAAIVRVGLPIAVILAATAAGLADYDLRTTGSALRTPYMVDHQTYDVAPLFVWERVRPAPAYRHRELREFHVRWEMKAARLSPSTPPGDFPWYAPWRSLRGFVSVSASKLFVLSGWVFPLRLLAIPLVTLPAAAIRDRRLRPALAMLAVFLLGILCATYLTVHYAAPVAGLVVYSTLQGARLLRARLLGRRPAGRAAFRIALALWALGSVVVYAFALASRPAGFRVERAAVLDELGREGGRHLVIVRYGAAHDLDHEWVYNDADIDSARVVWAREMPGADRELLDYYKDRRAWLLEADAERPRLEPYPAAAAP